MLKRSFLISIAIFFITFPLWAAKEEIDKPSVSSIEQLNKQQMPVDFKALIEKRHELEEMKFLKLSEISKVEKNIELQKNLLAEQKKKLNKRLRTLRQMSEFPVISRLFNQNTHTSLQNIEIMKFLIQRDTNLIFEYQELLKTQRNLQAELKGQLAEIDRMGVLLKTYDESIELKVSLEKEGSYVLSNKGRLSSPVNCPVGVGYGQLPNPDEVYLFFKGQFFDCPSISKVKTIAPGRVVHLDRDAVNGLVMIIDHGGNFLSVYSGLKATYLALNDRVTNEQSVGEAGAFELFEKRGFYFELRYGSTPLNPSQWIKN